MSIRRLVGQSVQVTYVVEFSLPLIFHSSTSSVCPSVRPFIYLFYAPRLFSFLTLFNLSPFSLSLLLCLSLSFIACAAWHKHWPFYPDLTGTWETMLTRVRTTFWLVWTDLTFLSFSSRLLSFTDCQRNDLPEPLQGKVHAIVLLRTSYFFPRLDVLI
jgi:hypothetical protein